MSKTTSTNQGAREVYGEVGVDGEVTLKDEEGNQIGISKSPLYVVQTTDVFDSILAELKIMNAHLSLINDVEIKCGDIE